MLYRSLTTLRSSRREAHLRVNWSVRLGSAISLFGDVWLELFSGDDHIGRLVALDENLDVRRAVNHLACIMHQLALVTDRLAYLSHYLSKLLHHILDKVNLAVIVLLNSIKPCPILRPDFIHSIVQVLDRSLVLELVLGRLVLERSQLLGEGRLGHGQKSA